MVDKAGKLHYANGGLNVARPSVKENREGDRKTSSVPRHAGLDEQLEKLLPFLRGGSLSGAPDVDLLAIAYDLDRHPEKYSPETADLLAKYLLAQPHFNGDRRIARMNHYAQAKIRDRKLANYFIEQSPLLNQKDSKTPGNCHGLTALVQEMGYLNAYKFAENHKHGVVPGAPAIDNVLKDIDSTILPVEIALLGIGGWLIELKNEHQLDPRRLQVIQEHIENMNQFVAGNPTTEESRHYIRQLMTEVSRDLALARSFSQKAFFKNAVSVLQFSQFAACQNVDDYLKLSGGLEKESFIDDACKKIMSDIEKFKERRQETYFNNQESVEYKVAMGSDDFLTHITGLNVKLDKGRILLEYIDSNGTRLLTPCSGHHVKEFLETALKKTRYTRFRLEPQKQLNGERIGEFFSEYDAHTVIRRGEKNGRASAGKPYTFRTFAKDDPGFTTPAFKYWYKGSLISRKEGIGFLDRSGNQYQGEVLYGFKHGKGELTFPDGSKYAGNFEYDEMTAPGTFTAANQRVLDLYLDEHNRVQVRTDLGGGVTYQGDVAFTENSRIVLTGKGRMQSPAWTYEGEFQNGIRCGEGKISYANGIVYQGAFKNNAENGKGLQRFPSGSVQFGFFSDGVIQDGELRHANGTRYEGSFLNGIPEGKGKLWKDDEIYEGQFYNGAKDGEGQLIFADKRAYIGTFANNKIEGRGKMMFQDGTIYEGEFSDGKFEGIGKLYYPDRIVYEGSFANNLPHGEGVLRNPNGGTEAAIFLHGVRQ